MAMDSVPERYLDAWARLQCQKPTRVSDAEWRQAIDDAGRFLDQWGSLAVQFGWRPSDLFDIPGDGKPAVPAKNAQTEFSCGLAWFLKGERVRGLGPEHAALGDGTRVFDRVTRREWVNSYIGRDK